MRNLLGISMLCVCATATFSQENYSTWAHSAQFSINTTSSSGGANVVNTETNFPVLVRLTPANPTVFTQAAAGGIDIRFTASNGTTRLMHQRVRWNSTADSAEFWVLIPTVAGNAITTFNMYWGNSSAADSSNGATVFNATTGFKSAWHLNEATGNAVDATGSGYDGTPSTSAPTAATGAPLPGGRAFSGVTQYLYMPTPTAGANNGVTGASYFEFGVGAGYSASAWLANTYSTTYAIQGIISHGNQDWQLQMQNATNCGTGSAAGCYAWSEWSTTAAYQNAYEPTPLHDGNWHYVMGVRYITSPYLVLYIDGVQSATFTTNDGTAKTGNGNGVAFTPVLGAYTTSAAIPPATSNYYSGSMVEATVASVSRDSSWVKLSFATQNPNQTAVTAPSITTALLPSTARSSQALDLQVTGSQVLMRLPELTGNAQVTIMDLSGRKVWNQNVEMGTREISWNSKAQDGLAGSGVYVVRLFVSGAGQGMKLAAESKILLTP